MKMTLSERDKRLLSLLSAALILVLFVRFALLPCVEKAGELQDALLAAEQTKTEMEMQISTLSKVDGNIAAAQERLAQKNQGFYSLLTNDELDDLVTGIILNNDLASMSMKITGAAVQPITPYFASPLAQNSASQPAATPAPEQNAIPDAAAAALPEAQLPYVPPLLSNAEQYLHTAIVDCAVTGSRASFVRLLDRIEEDYPAIRVQRFAIEDVSYLAPDLSVRTDAKFTMTLYVYMCDKAGDTL